MIILLSHDPRGVLKCLGQKSAPTLTSHPHPLPHSGLLDTPNHINNLDLYAIRVTALRVIPLNIDIHQKPSANSKHAQKSPTRIRMK